MTRSAQESPVPETGTPGLRWRGLETAYGEPIRARSWKRRIQPRGAYGALRQSSTLPKQLGGSAWEAAVTSFVLFAIGAVVPILPFVVAHGSIAVAASVVISAVGLFSIGGAITLFTGAPVWRSGGRQLLLGLAAAGLTFGVGKLIGTAIGN